MTAPEAELGFSTVKFFDEIDGAPKGRSGHLAPATSAVLSWRQAKRRFCPVKSGIVAAVTYHARVSDFEASDVTCHAPRATSQASSLIRM
jgi:hypothetical protein